MGFLIDIMYLTRDLQIFVLIFIDLLFKDQKFIRIKNIFFIPQNYFHIS